MVLKFDHLKVVLQHSTPVVVLIDEILHVNFAASDNLVSDSYYYLGSILLRSYLIYIFVVITVL